MLMRVLSLIAFAASLSAAPVEILPTEQRAAQQPQVAVGAKGEIHVVFGQKDGAIYHTVSVDEARTFRGPVKIGALPKLALGMHRGPRLAVAGERVVVTAISHEGGDLLAWSSTDRGVTWTGPATLNTAPKSAREGLHAMAAGGERVAVAWLDLRNSGTELWGAVSKNGGASWEPDARIYQSPDGSICQCCAPSLAFGPRGELAAMWRNAIGGARDLYSALSRDGGQTFGPAEKLGAGTWKLNACPMDGGSMTFAPAGNRLAVWRRERTVFASEASAPEKQLTVNAAQPLAGYAGRTRLILWEASGGLMLQRGSEAPVRFAENAAAASIASGPETAVIAWEATVNGAKTILIDRVR